MSDSKDGVTPFQLYFLLILLILTRPYSLRHPESRWIPFLVETWTHYQMFNRQ